MTAGHAQSPDWEAFYCAYRSPGYVPGFQITTRLGGGMFGLVFRARRMSIGKDYAIKFLRVDDVEVRRAVVAELERVKLFAQIDHPNLVAIEDRGEVDGIPYLVMAFAGTETLRDRMVAGAVPTGEAKDLLAGWFVQCCRGLAALHERSLVHFDIKPANVFLKGDVARLGDYGLSKLVTHSQGSLSMGRGTPYYMAPELLQRRGDHRSDIYSLGVMLYELLCGRVPFTGDSEWEVLKQHEAAAVELPAHLTATERAVLARCLHKDPARRFASVNELMAAFGFGPVAAAMVVAPAAPVALAATTSGAADLPPSCVPPLPPSPPRAQRRPLRAPAHSRRGVLVGLGLAALALLFFADRKNDRQAKARQSTAANARSPARSGTVATNALETMVNSVLRSARTAASREKRSPLRPLELSKFNLGGDHHLRDEQVEALARAPTFLRGQAQKIDKLGRSALVAGVAQLQQLDYDAPSDCLRAANLLRLLEQMTAIEGLSVEVPEEHLSERELCRLLSLADGWRRLAEKFATDEAAFLQLTARRRVRGVDR